MPSLVASLYMVIIIIIQNMEPGLLSIKMYYNDSEYHNDDGFYPTVNKTPLFDSAITIFFKKEFNRKVRESYWKQYYNTKASIKGLYDNKGILLLKALIIMLYVLIN